MYNGEAKGILLASVISALKDKNLALSNSLIYYVTKDEHHINCWYDPVPEHIVIPVNDAMPSREGQNDCVTLYIRKLEENQDTTSEESSPTRATARKPKRAPERTIKEVKVKVEQWKAECKQLKEQNPMMKRVAEKAAETVGIPKKSLDDYMHQLKMGQLHNFEFFKNEDTKIGVLRQFNKRFGGEKEKGQ